MIHWYTVKIKNRGFANELAKSNGVGVHIRKKEKEAGAVYGNTAYRDHAAGLAAGVSVCHI
jgi:hypothetical protein